MYRGRSSKTLTALRGRLPNKGKKMFKKQTSVLLAALMLCLGVAPLKVVAGQETAEARNSTKLKAEVAKRGMGQKAHVTVELRNRRKVKGYVSSVGEEDFVVTDPKTG
jgi:hypothetical protein